MMSISASFRRLFAVLMVLGLVASGCSDDGKDIDRAATNATDGGDDVRVSSGAPVSAAAVAAAAGKLAEATSFRFEGTAEQLETGGTAIAQRVQVAFEAPATLHVRRLALDGSLQLEQWLTAEKVYVREPPQPDGRESPVRCAEPGEAPTADPRLLLREVAKITKAKPSDKGGAEFDLPATAAAIAFGPQPTGEYTATSGRATVVGEVLGLLHVEATFETKKLTADFLYADVGSAAVELPQADC